MSEHQQPKEYIITEPQLAAIEIVLKQAGIPMKRNVLLTEIRSRPHPAPEITHELRNELLCEAITALNSESGFDYHVRDWLAIHDAAIERKAREECIKHQRKIEDKIVHGIKLSDEQFRGIDKIFSESIKSLRSTQQQAGEP